MEYPTCIQSLKQKEFLLQLAQEKSSYFNWKYRLIRLFYFQKCRNFIGSRSCPNLTKLGREYPMCAQILKQKELLLLLAQEKSLYCIRKFAIISNKFTILILKIGLIRRVKELSKSNHTRYGVFHVYLESKIETIFAIACLGKKFVFNRKYRLIRLFYFQKYRNFIGSRSCPNLTKLGMEYPMCAQIVKQKDFCYSLPRKKVSIAYGNLLLFRINLQF